MNPSENLKFWVFGAFLIILQFLFLYSHLSQSECPFGEDQDAYLKDIALAQQGKEYFDGQKNPLMPVVLSLVVPEGEDSYTASRLWVIALTLLMTLGQLIWARKLWGTGTALLWAYFLAFNSTALELGFSLMVEPWLLHFVGFFLLSWVDAQRKDSVTSWLLVGFFLGIGLLAKGTIPVLMTATGLALLLAKRFKPCLCVMLSALVVYSPFLIYRQIRFGDPFYQVSQGLSWLGFYHPLNLKGSSFSEFVAEQGIGGLFDRLFDGLLQMPKVAFSALGPISSSWKFSLLILLVLVLMGIGIWLWRRNVDSPVVAFRKLPAETKWLAFIWFGLWLMFCSWMAPVALVTRYFIPLVPLVGAAIVLLWRRPRINILLANLFFVFTMVSLPWPVFDFENFKNPDRSWKQDLRYQNYCRIRRVVEENSSSKRTKIFYGPGRTLPETWLWDYQRISLPYEFQTDKKKIKELISQADYMVLDKDVINNNGALFEEWANKLLKELQVSDKQEIEGQKFYLIWQGEGLGQGSTYLFKIY